MKLIDFKNALEEGKTKVVFTDVDGKEYTHTILKAGNKQVSLFNEFRKVEYRIKFTTHHNYPNYRINN